jgi:3-hydroxyacyl-CoA dehydrogenase
MRATGAAIPSAVEKLLATGGDSWYRAGGTEYFDVKAGAYRPVYQNPEHASVNSYKRSNGVFAGNSGISLVDVGDGIGCFEFHSKMNSLGHDIVSFLLAKLKPGSDAVRNFDGFIIASDAQNFTVGANLMQLLLGIQDEEWDEIELSIRQFQGMTQAIKFSPKPVVASAFGLCLGGGTEISLHAAARQPHAELYTGLVEVGVGLLPGGGGCKEILLRAVDGAAAARGSKGSGDALAGSIEMLEAMKRAFENIATARVATSAHEARALGFLTDSDRITMNRERVLSDAKARALELVRSGYEPPVPRTDIPAPGENLLATLKLGVHMMRQGDYITDYEVKLGAKIAEVLCGGNVTPGTPISEQYILDLEREGFKSLSGEKKTQERIQYTLKTGKTLRN